MDITTAVDAHVDWALGVLDELVAAPSLVGSERECCHVFARHLDALGFTVTNVAVPDDIGAVPGAGVPALPYDGRGDVLGTRGSGERSLLLNGHLDIVPEGESGLWTSPPYSPTTRGGRVYGRGAGDMKAGFAMGMLAIRALDDTDAAWLDGRLDIVGVIEEECTGNGTLAAIHAGVTADAVVLLEPTGLDLLVGGVGVLWLDIDVTGAAGHAERADRSTNPVDLAMVVVAGLRSWADVLWHEHPEPLIADGVHPYAVNLGQLHAGDWTSSVPSVARLQVRLGFPRGWTADRAIADVTAHIEHIADSEPRFPRRPVVRPSGFRAPGYLQPEGSRVETLLAQAHRDVHGTTPQRMLLGATTDARYYINDVGVPAVCYGPTAYDIHGVDESVDIASIIDGAKTLATFLQRWYA